MLTMVICYTQPFTKPIKVEVFGKWVFGKWVKLYSLHVSTYLIAKIKSFYSGLCVGSIKFYIISLATITE